MKKALVALALLLFTTSVDAVTLKLAVRKETVENLNRVGHTILNANRIPHHITFRLVDKEYSRVWLNARENTIKITDEYTKYFESDDELAATLAHYIAQAADRREGVLRGSFTSIANALSPKKYEYKADKVAVDYLVKAGYNPLALIVTINKMAPQTRFDWCGATPLATRRMAEVYEYIYTKYPQYLVQNSYKDNVYYQNFLLTSKENRAKLEQKVKNNSKRKVNYL